MIIAGAGRKKNSWYRVTVFFRRVPPGPRGGTKIFSLHIYPKFSLNEAVSKQIVRLYIITCLSKVVQAFPTIRCPIRLPNHVLDPKMRCYLWSGSGIVAVFPAYPGGPAVPPLGICAEVRLPSPGVPSPVALCPSLVGVGVPSPTPTPRGARSPGGKRFESFRVSVGVGARWDCPPPPQGVPLPQGNRFESFHVSS